MNNITLSIVTLALLVACDSGQDQPDAYGNFEAEEIFVSAETSGKIVTLDFREGDMVRKGEILAMIDTIPLFLQKGQLLASKMALRQKLQNVPVQLDVLGEREKRLEKEVDRLGKLLKSGAATQKQFDDLSGELAIVKKQKTALHSQLSSANRAILSEIEPLNWRLKQVEDMMARSMVKSPVAGTILQKFRSEGEITGPGVPLAKLASLNQMTLRIFISGDQLSGLTLGDQVMVNIDNKNGALESFEGKVEWISSRAEFTPKTIQTRTERVNQVYAVKIRVNNDGSIKIGMPAEVIF